MGGELARRWEEKVTRDLPNEKTAPWPPCLSTVSLVNYYLIDLAGELPAIQLGHTLLGVRFGLGLGSGSTGGGHVLGRMTGSGISGQTSAKKS
jgi:hypothetical protein